MSTTFWIRIFPTLIPSVLPANDLNKKIRVVGSEWIEVMQSFFDVIVMTLTGSWVASIVLAHQVCRGSARSRWRYLLLYLLNSHPADKGVRSAMIYLFGVFIRWVQLRMNLESWYPNGLTEIIVICVCNLVLVFCLNYIHLVHTKFVYFMNCVFPLAKIHAHLFPLIIGVLWCNYSCILNNIIAGICHYTIIFTSRMQNYQSALFYGWRLCLSVILLTITIIIIWYFSILVVHNI